MRRPLLLLALILGLFGRVVVARAAEAEEKKPAGPWSNSTELSLILTTGNSSVETLGLKNTLEHKAEEGQWRLRVDTMRSNTSDDPFLLVAPGQIFEPGETPSTASTTIVRPGSEPDVARYFVEGRYEGNLAEKGTWNSGASWARDEDAGILNRFIVFAGVGNVWRDTDDLVFRTSYGVSYTDREEDVPDPEKDRRFPGARLSSYFKDKWGEPTTYDNDFTFNLNLTDVSDYNLEMVQGVAVAMSKRLSLKVSLQWTYAGEPALEEVDVILRALLIDPDGIPGNGDEFFQTVESGGVEIEVGEDRIRKKSSDLTFRTSLLISI